jgi:hypothetical protein
VESRVIINPKRNNPLKISHDFFAHRFADPCGIAPKLILKEAQNLDTVRLPSKVPEERYLLNPLKKGGWQKFKGDYTSII